MIEVYCPECKYLSDCSTKCKSPNIYQIDLFFFRLFIGCTDPYELNNNNDCPWFEAASAELMKKRMDMPIREGSVKKGGIGKKPLSRRPPAPKPQTGNVSTSCCSCCQKKKGNG
jgi:hypothetical protein